MPYSLVLPCIVAAAIKFEDGFVVVGARHYDKWMVDQIQRAYPDKKAISGTQGFIDQRGNFHNRTDAWKIADENDQIKRRVGGDEANGGTLYSENLY